MYIEMTIEVYKPKNIKITYQSLDGKFRFVSRSPRPSVLVHSLLYTLTPSQSRNYDPV
jgi:hypothetical protein